jgi:hypothetical protein
MRRLGVTRFVLVAGLVAVAALVSFGLGSARGTDFTLQLQKGCDGTPYVGDPYFCHSHLANQDSQGNAYIIHALVDRINSSNGVTAKNLFALGVPLVFVNFNNATPVSCTNGTGTGTTADPFIPTASTTCTLPGDLTLAGKGGQLNVGDTLVGANRDYSVYTVLPGDYTANPQHSLSDQIDYTVTNACNVVSSNCDSSLTNEEQLTASATVQKRKAQATTTILAGADPVTTIVSGTTVHDSGTVSEDTANENPPPVVPGPVPTGTVSITFFQGGTCNGTVLDTGSATLDASGNFNATTMPETPTTPGMYSFQATYNGDGTYNASPASGCEPLQVVNANIQITPATATNPIGTNHVLTITVNALGGTIDAAGGTATASIISGPGSFVGSPSCTYTGGAATSSCTVTITSNVAGTSVIQATSNIPVSGLSITRTTNTAVNTAAGGSGNAQKIWVQPDANIQITPATATNPVNTNHVLTCHINTSPDSVTYSNAPDGTTCTVNIISGPGTPATQSCLTSGGTGSCQVTITSATTGTSVVQATTTVTVNSVVLTRTTGDAHVGDGPNARKVWVDANINITPATANNPIGANHVLTITVNAINGTIDAGPHTATASIVSGPGSFVGSPTCTYTGGAATASCTVTITSSTPGTTVVSATSNIPVSGTVITRTTGTAVNTASGGSGNASKNWADDVVVTHVRDANNADITGQTVTPGTVVHDEADVTKAAGTPAAVPAPTGTVTFTLFDNGTCNGNVVATDANEPLNASGVANSATFTTTTGTFSYLAHYNGDANYPAHDAQSCEPFTVQGNFGPALTPGFWKTHQAATTALLPITLGNYNVNTFAKALAIFNAMKCSAPIDCLAGHLLAAKLDLAGGSDPSILPVIAQADALLIAVNYNGPGNYTPPTAAQKSLALQLEVLIDAYTNQ